MDSSSSGSDLADQQQRPSLWVVEEAFGDESLHARLERGLLSWQQVR